MKRLIILLFIICGFSPLIWAVDGCNQERLSPEEFRAKQKAFIIEKAYIGNTAAHTSCKILSCVL